jgi:hypothetical protein
MQAAQLQACWQLKYRHLVKASRIGHTLHRYTAGVLAMVGRVQQQAVNLTLLLEAAMGTSQYHVGENTQPAVGLCRIHKAG